MSPRVMRLVKWFGYSSYAIVIFLTMIYLTFPQERVKAVLEAKLSTPEREVRIGGLSVYPLLRLKAEEVRVTLRPPVRRSALRPGALPRKEGEKEAKAKKKVKAKRLVLERVSINVGLLALFRGGVDATFEVKGFGGTLSGRYAMARKGKRIKRWHLEVEAEGISAKEVPQIQTAGPPFSGTISGKATIDAPLGQLSRSTGDVALEVGNAVVGDDKWKLKIKGNLMLAQGVTLPKISLGRVTLKAKLEKGKVRLETLSARSDDVELKVDGGLTFRRPLPFSTIKSYVMFKVSPKLIKRKPALELLGQALGKARRDDGFYGLLIRGIFRVPRVTPSKLGFGTGRPGRGGAGRRSGLVGVRRLKARGGRHR